MTTILCNAHTMRSNRPLILEGDCTCMGDIVDSMGVVVALNWQQKRPSYDGLLIEA